MTTNDDHIADNLNTIQPKHSKRRHYQRLTPAQKLAIKAQLDLGDTSISQLARTNNVDRHTIYNVMNDVTLPILSSKALDRTRKGLSSLMLNNALFAQKHVNSDKLSKSSFVQLMVGSKIGIEASNLLSGLSTSNISIRSTIENIDRQREEIVQRLKELE